MYGFPIFNMKYWYVTIKEYQAHFVIYKVCGCMLYDFFCQSYMSSTQMRKHLLGAKNLQSHCILNDWWHANWLEMASANHGGDSYLQKLYETNSGKLCNYLIHLNICRAIAMVGIMKSSDRDSSDLKKPVIKI